MLTNIIQMLYHMNMINRIIKNNNN